MRRIIALVSAVSLLTLLMLPNAASAQSFDPDAPPTMLDISVSPSNVEAAGTFDVMVTSEAGWAGSPMLLVCAMPDTMMDPSVEGSLMSMTAGELIGWALDNCDISSSVTPTLADDGSFEETLTAVDIPAEGVLIMAGETNLGLAAMAPITVSEMMDDTMMDDTMMDDTMMDDTSTEETMMDDTMMEDDMTAPEGGAETGFGGTAGGQGMSTAMITMLVGLVLASAVAGSTVLLRLRRARA